MLRRFWPLALALAVLPGCASANAPPLAEAAAIQGSAIHTGQWVAACSNERVCIAIAPLRDDAGDDERAHIQFIFGAEIADAQSVAILRGGEEIEVFSPLAVHLLTQELLKRGAADPVHRSEQAVRYHIPRQGFAKVMDVFRHWRELPAPQPRSTATVTPIPAPLIEDIGVPAALADVARRCPAGHMGESLQAWSGFGGKLLWRAGCGSEGLNPVSFWFTAGPQGAPPEPVQFTDGASAVTPYNSWFEESTGFLRVTHFFGQHRGNSPDDCGIYRAYGWGVDGMELVERRIMPVCGTGIGPKGWFMTYRAAVFNAPDSGP